MIDFRVKKPIETAAEALAARRELETTKRLAEAQDRQTRFPDPPLQTKPRDDASPRDARRMRLRGTGDTPALAGRSAAVLGTA
jgi:hypothetical protein